MIEEKVEDVFTFEKLYKGHLKGRCSKRDRKSLVKFEMGTLGKIYEVYDRIQRGIYKTGRYSTFVIKEPKQREIQTLKYEDRVVQHAICDNVIAPYFTKRAIEDNCVCQIGKGTHYALKRFEKMLKNFVQKNGQKGYFLKCDIEKYFPSLSHRVLKRILIKEIKDKKLQEFLCEIVESYHTKVEYLNRYNINPIETEEGKTGRGVPIGNQTSQTFGMYYLNDLDRMLKEKYQVKIYSRYMDDFIMVFDTKKKAQDILEIIREKVAELDLQLNSRTQIFPLKNGVSYLGFRYQINKDGKVIKKVTKKTKKRFVKREKLLRLAYSKGLIKRERVEESLNAYHGHLMHGNCFKLEREVSGGLRKMIIEDEKNEKELLKTTNKDQKETRKEDFDTKEHNLTTLEKEGLASTDDVARKNFIIDALATSGAGQKDMAVITHAKKLGEYILIITEKSPKKYRWSIVSKLQNCSSQIIDCLYQANFEKDEKREFYQTRAGVELNLLDFYAETAKKMQAITIHQMEVIAKQIFETKKLLGGWIRSTKKKKISKTCE